MIPGLGRSPGEGIGYLLQYFWAALVAQMVKNLTPVWETWVQSLCWEDPLEKGKVTIPVFLGFPGVSAGKETWVQSLCWEDPPGKGTTTHSSILVERLLH